MPHWCHRLRHGVRRAGAAARPGEQGEEGSPGEDRDVEESLQGLILGFNFRFNFRVGGKKSHRKVWKLKENGGNKTVSNCRSRRDLSNGSIHDS